MILVSACLAGVSCRYDGTSSLNPAVADLVRRGEALAVCPETLGGLPVPRVPCEIVSAEGQAVVVSRDGRDFTAAFLLGARKTLDTALEAGVSRALLKRRSPSCGIGEIYDGSFTGRLTRGDGLAAALLAENGIEVIPGDEYGGVADHEL